MLTDNPHPTQIELNTVNIVSPANEPHLEALQMLAETSRTFYIPVSRLPPGLLEAVGSAYLCLRAIDEVEDHPDLSAHTRAAILRGISRALLEAGDGFGWNHLVDSLNHYAEVLPPVTLRLPEWLQLPPDSIAARVWDATASMADRMARWVDNGFAVHTEADLDNYTFGVAGAVGLLLSDLWAWYDGTPTNRLHAIGFGRGLQAVNILRNRVEDLSRGVDFYPDGWGESEMQIYARRNLGYADDYVRLLRPGPALDFCRIPLALAYATVDALSEGREKLTRNEVNSIVEDALRDG